MALNSLYIGSLYTTGKDRIAPLPDRIKQHAPAPEPRPPPGTPWIYRVSEPFYTSQGIKNVNDALATGMISSASVWPQKLAERLAEFYEVPIVFPTSSGATALVVALLAADIGPGDQVLCPAMTMVAVCNAVKMVGATPVYVDCGKNMINPGAAEYMAKANPKVKCIITCNTFGVPAPMKEIVEMCRSQCWVLIEDVCESIGTTSGGQVVGTFGDFACGSLYANKIVTAGDGGWVMTKDKTKHDRLKSLVNHGFDPLYHFLHFETAPNAKINGLGAALACASIDKIPEVNAHRHWLSGAYRKALQGTSLTLMEKGDKDEPWVIGVVCASLGEKNDLRSFLAKNRIETRNYFFPLHLQPVNFFQGTQTYDIELKEAERLGDCGFYLPSHHYLEERDVEHISAVVKAFFAGDNGKVPSCPRDVDWVDRTKSKAY
jgi:dTDP-4-amino-4,6-dideoxygalactose transaminase